MRDTCRIHAKIGMLSMVIRRQTAPGMGGRLLRIIHGHKYQRAISVYMATTSTHDTLAWGSLPEFATGVDVIEHDEVLGVE